MVRSRVASDAHVRLCGVFVKRLRLVSWALMVTRTILVRHSESSG